MCATRTTAGRKLGTHGLGAWVQAWLSAALLVLLVWGALPGAAHAGLPGAPTLAPIATQGHEDAPITLNRHGEWWLDTSGSASAEAASRVPAAQWRPAQADELLPTASGQAVWFRFWLAPADSTRHWVVEVAFPNLNRVTRYIRSDAGDWQAASAGDQLPVAAWPVAGRQPVLPLAWSGDQPVPVLLRIEHGHPTAVPLRLIEERTLLRREATITLGLGLYFGFCLLTALTALVAAAWMRDSATALFALPTLLLAMATAGFSGVSGWLLWPGHATWNKLAIFGFPTLALVGMLVFLSVATALRARSPRARYAVWALGGGGIALAALGSLLPDAPLAQATAVYAGVLLLACLALPAWTWWRGDSYSAGLLVGMACLTAPVSLHVMRLVTALPSGTAPRFALLGAMAMQSAVVLVTLIWRGRDRSLTRQRVRGLHRTDPVTGVASQTVVGDILRRMTARGQRLDHAFAVLLVDLTNLRELRRLLGRRAEQEVVLRTADRLLQVAREIDTVGRASDRRFALLIEGPITPERAQRRAQRVLVRCQQPLPGRPQAWTPVLRVAVAVMPRDGRDPAQVLDALNVLLDTVAPGDARALFALS